MQRYWRLLRIETRRSFAIWVFPVMVGLGWYAAREQYRDGVELWPDTSARIARASVFIGPFIAGAAAWAAYQERRRRLNELLVTMSGSTVGRAVTVWIATTAWATLAYVLIGTFQGISTAQSATWGAPATSLLLAGLVALATYTAVGYLIGTLLPYLFTVPFVALTLYLLPGFTYSLNHESPLRMLSPWTVFDPSQYSVLRGIWPEYSVPMMIWLIGISATALTGIALFRSRSLVSSLGIALSLLISVTGATMLLDLPPGAEATEAATIPYEPACTMGTVTVCVHPAYKAVLGETASTVEDVLEPIKGLPGIPQRFEQFAYLQGTLPKGIVDIAPYNEYNGVDHLAQSVVGSIISDSPDSLHGEPRESSAAECAIERWLVRRIDLEPNAHGIACMPNINFGSYLQFDEMNSDIDVAATRFGELSTVEQRRWLVINWDLLREGRLLLTDIP